MKPMENIQENNTALWLRAHLPDICRVFPVIPKPDTTDSRSPRTAASVATFQRFFGLPPTGEPNFETQEKIREVHTGLPRVNPPRYPGAELREGSRGGTVAAMQRCLRAVAEMYPSVPLVEADGIFGPKTVNAATVFQRQFGLEPTGRINEATWNSVISAYHLITTERSESPPSNNSINMLLPLMMLLLAKNANKPPEI
jgi:peptidoglycan hydrolase-like protein with peptidoglycan-binding domain